MIALIQLQGKPISKSTDLRENPNLYDHKLVEGKFEWPWLIAFQLLH